MRNDVALLKLCSPVQLGNMVQTACLPPPNEDGVFPGEQLTVLGWGAEYFGGPPVGSLKEVRD